MPLRGRTADHLDNACFSASIHLEQCSTGIRDDFVNDNIGNAILNIRLNDICYGSRSNSIAVSNQGMGEPCFMLFIRLMQYQALL